MKRLVVAFSLLLITIGLEAQPGAYGRGCFICSVELGAGWYKPGLDYLNEESYLTDVNGEFNGGLTANALVDVKLLGNLIATVGAGYWNDRVNVDDFAFPGAIVLDEFLSITMIPVIAQLKYEFPLGGGGYPGSVSSTMAHLRPYIGAGTTINFTTQKYERVQDGEVTDKGTLSGNSQTFHGIAGIKNAINGFIDVGIEYNHWFGGFDQAFIDEGNQTIENINLGGPMILGKVTLFFIERPGFRNTKALKRFKGKYKSPKRR